MLEDAKQRIKANVHAATTGDLLDRATVYRNGLEPEALELIEEELRQRGVTVAQQVEHATQYIGVLHGPDGLVLYCDYCEYLVPAVWRGWQWYWYAGLVPLFPIRVSLCAKHRG
jgi:hypothetical protein